MRSILLLLLALLPALASASSIAVDPALDVRTPGWTEQLRSIPAGSRIEVGGLQEAGRASGELILDLERFRIVDAESRVVVNSRKGRTVRALPQRRYFQGSIRGEADSRALLILGHDGSVRGLVRRAGRVQALVVDPARTTLVDVDTAAAAEPFQCGASDLTLPPLPADEDRPDPDREIRGVPSNGYLARIAFETDFEYFQRFGNTDDAAAYAMDLVAFSSTIYAAEASTRLALSTIYLWTDPSDPWSESSTICGLFEFGQYWNDNRTDDRTIAHFLSGKNLGGGVAWVGVLCNGGFDVNTSGAGCSFSDISNYGGDYGFSADLDGNFDLSNPSAVWDIVVVAHEIGHNFNSPHTHCYIGVDGVNQPVDQCWGTEQGASCYAGANTLPGPIGAGSGTIMSYCHLNSGGLGNISLTLGLDHSFGVAPERVPNRMMAAAIAAESGNPGCLTTELGAELDLVGTALDVIEGEDVALTLRLDRPASADILVDLVEDAALAGNLGNLTGHLIPAGMNRLDLLLPTVDDTVFAPPREGWLSVQTVTSDVAIDLGNTALPVRITDDDPTLVTLTASANAAEVIEGTTLEVTVALDPPADAPVEITLAPDPAITTRIDSGLGPLTVAAGAASIVFPVTFIDDQIDQPDLVSGIAIGAVDSTAQTTIGTPGSVSFELLDNDEPPVVLVLSLSDSTVVEGGSVQATVLMDPSTTVPVQVELEATPALAALVASGLGPRTIAPGSTATVFEIAFADDDQVTQARVSGTISIGEVVADTDASLGTPSEQALEWRDNDLPPDDLLTDSFEGT
ncbi:hypothetical protein HFP89_06260 [Wenzhouxiangella sp. XN79A]|uniref:M12 family metallo-peptidase n=1 Tax=Wenzhouxiangella sp. XN79A TaxID=2724193 RepID=UPI00144ADAD5|nr:M12 family metallo-peptidase [Wenzhouxiangella sp. XN79A]NKI34765.1 hypothetical protein [Wenzhouxiangella sp. XN79A]